MKTYKDAQVKNETELAVDALLSRVGVTYTVNAAGESLMRDGWEYDGWRIELRKGKAIECFDYGTGIGHRVCLKPRPKGTEHSYNYREWLAHYVKPFAPFAAGVIYSFLLESPARGQSFREWCSEYGYDADSIKANRTYYGCRIIAEKLGRVFTHDEIAELQTLLEDY